MVTQNVVGNLILTYIMLWDLLNDFHFDYLDCAGRYSEYQSSNV